MKIVCQEKQKGRRAQRSRSAFTLIEVMVALAIMMLLLAIIFVPMNQAINFLHIGQARTGLQQAGREIMAQMERDLRLAIHVYPNAKLPSVTSKPPYNGKAPYISGNQCDGSNVDISNTSRIDILLPELDANGQVSKPVKPANYIVTYYARRFDMEAPWDKYTNPLMLFRAQYPYREKDGDEFVTPEGMNAEITANRYIESGPDRCDEDGTRWLKQRFVPESEDDSDRENNNEPYHIVELCEDATDNGVVPSSHVLISPRNTALTLPLDSTGRPIKGTDAAPGPGLKPATTFVCDDVDENGKIDRVTINLALEAYDQGSAGQTEKNSMHTVRMSTVVDLPNVQ